jgi:hypothetical protein
MLKGDLGVSSTTSAVNGIFRFSPEQDIIHFESLIST